jgi:CreA protein
MLSALMAEAVKMKLPLLSLLLLLAATCAARADDDFPCISTTFNLLSPNDKVCISEFEDPGVPGVACYISQARTGGWGQAFGLNEDPSNFSVSCRQIGPITADLAKLPKKEEAFSQKTSIFFKRTRIYRLPDPEHRVIVYVAVSSKLVNGSPANSVDVVPVLPWPTAQ